jgi:hypothetical protein
VGELGYISLCANASELSDLSFEEKSAAGERVDSGPGTRAVAESL